jgi:CRISPR-associated endonuclease/helicase Cas3
VIKAYEYLFKGEFDYTLHKLKKQHGFCFNFDELMKFILIMHDYGKLNKAWQLSIKKYQSQKSYVGESEMLAHSDYDPRIDFDIKVKLPNHAGIGAAVAASVIEGIFNDSESLCISVLNSIAKHHSITSNSMQSFSIVNDGKKSVLELLKKHCPSIYQKIDFDNKYLSKGNSQRFDNYSVDYYSVDTNYEAVLYFIFSRILRLCDQKSFDYRREVNVY